MGIGQSLEDYLETILIIRNKKGYVHSIDIAEHLNFSRPSVTRATRELSKMGYILIQEGHWILTEKGDALAERIYEKHRFFTEYLSSVGVPKEIAERDACRMEHTISDESFQKIKEMLQNKR
ncbi:MAG: metal-dependent transcriptional regulator [Anaerotignum sp.]|nr:metal-dependent transcriptional regulator [Anaerotignum sp.]